MNDTADFDKDDEDMFFRSGCVESQSFLIYFIYRLVNDYVQPSDVEAIVREVVSEGPHIEYANGWLADYSKDIAKRLLNKL